uniref:Uncharacterized protein n=1 Tax=Cacopsylla melanoneura TaxID=428564 RepID=A0A8D8VMC7_9HEMI
MNMKHNMEQRKKQYYETWERTQHGKLKNAAQEEIENTKRSVQGKRRKTRKRRKWSKRRPRKRRRKGRKRRENSRGENNTASKQCNSNSIDQPYSTFFGRGPHLSFPRYTWAAVQKTGV